MGTYISTYIDRNSDRNPMRMAWKSFKNEGTKSTAINAVAFQDHLMQRLSLNSGFIANSHRCSRNSSTVNIVTPGGKSSKKLNSGVDCWLNKPRKKMLRNFAESKEKEVVLDPKPPPLSLAQKIGLVEAPKPGLTESDWQTVKQLSLKRGDSTQPCVICKEDFELREQVLLSCSHVFHKACIKAFERFSGKKYCPLCRTEKYQTRVVYIGADLHRIRAATTIQAYWRGYVIRKQYEKLMKHHIPNEPLLRRRFYEKKFSDVTEKLVQQCYQSNESADQVISNADQLLTLNKALMSSLSQEIWTLTQDEWKKILDKALQRNPSDCPICLMPLKSTVGVLHSQQIKFIEQRNDELATASSKTIEVLSCGHFFHTPCIQSMEEFCHTTICPVCRNFYVKQTLVILPEHLQ